MACRPVQPIGPRPNPSAHSRSDLDGVQPNLLTHPMDPQLTELMQLYPYMFNPDHIGLQMHAGWYPVFKELCAAIDMTLGDDKHGFCWAQTKEKFCWAYWYWEMEPRQEQAAGSSRSKSARPIRSRPDPEEELCYRITALVTKATAKTFFMCMACGADSDRREHAGRLMNCCQKHFDLLKVDPKAFWRDVRGNQEGIHG